MTEGVIMDKASELFRKSLSEAIKSGRISKKELSEKTGVSRSHLDRYLDGLTVPKLDHASKIAQAIGTTLAKILQGEKPPAGHSPEECLVRALDALDALDDDSVDAFAKRFFGYLSKR